MPRPSTYISRYNDPISGPEALFTSSRRFTVNRMAKDIELVMQINGYAILTLKQNHKKLNKPLNITIRNYFNK
jgi:hypothetical protein